MAEVNLAGSAPASLAEFRLRLSAAVATATIPVLLTAVAQRHIQDGWKTDCECSICDTRRRYVMLQSRPSVSQYGKNMAEESVDLRKLRKDTMRAFKRRALKAFKENRDA